MAGAAAAAGGAEALLTSARGSDLPSDMPIAVAAAREAIKSADRRPGASRSGHDGEALI